MLAFLASMSGAVPCAAGTVLSLEDCLELAGAKHPDMAAAAAAVAASRGRLASAAAGDRMQLSGSVYSTRNYGLQGESTGYSAGLMASIKLYDANRSKYSADASRSMLDAAGEDARGALADVRANVKTAYLALLLAYETEHQREESVRAFERHLDKAKGFFDAGAKPRYDVTKAEVDLGNAQLSRAEASAAVRDARATLANAMGIDPSEDFDVERAEPDVPQPASWALDSAETLAIDNRADRKSSAFMMESGRSALKAEARAKSPTVSLAGGRASATDDLSDSERFRHEWNIELKMSIPVYDGGAAKAGVDIARAQMDSLAASHEKLRQSILLEVSLAKNNITKAREGIRISRLTVANAEENLKLAEGRYETGVGDAIEVADAIVSCADARLSESRARHNLRTAIIDLEKAVGIDFGHDAENDGEKK
jgi:outer membrane protein TolC